MSMSQYCVCLLTFVSSSSLRHSVHPDAEMRAHLSVWPVPLLPLLLLLLLLLLFLVPKIVGSATILAVYYQNI